MLFRSDNYQDEYLIVRNSPVSLPYDYKEYVSMIYYVNNEDTIIRKSHVHFEPYFTLKDSILFKFEMAIQLYNQDEHIYILDLYRKKYGDPRNNSWFINQHEINYKIEDINKDFKFLLINYRNLKIEEEDISYRNKINELRQSERRIIDSIENEKVKKINSTKKKIVGTQKI